MTYQVQYEITATNALATALDDPNGIEAVLTFVDTLADDPRPMTAAAWGPEYRRVRIGEWRVLYRIDDEQRVVYVEQVGRVRDGGK